MKVAPCIGVEEEGRRERTPGDLLLHPAALVALAVVIFNDRVLKIHYPGVVSGKLSDFAGLVYFPLFLVAALELLRRLVRRSPWELTWHAVAVASVVVGVSFVLIKTWDPAGDAYRVGIGWALWVARIGPSLLADGEVPAQGDVGLVKDPWDLMALPMLLVPVHVARSVMGRRFL